MNKKIPQIRQIQRKNITTWDVALPQLKQVENHLLTHGKITTWKAITAYSITRLSAYINVLRNKGWTIKSIWKHNSERRWVLYQLKNYPNS